MTATLVWSTQTLTSADHIARIAAGSRLAAERLAAEAKRAEHRRAAEMVADSIMADLRADGAVHVGFKVCDDSGKWRMVYHLDGEADLIHMLLVDTYGEDAEVWGVRADGSYCGSVF